MASFPGLLYSQTRLMLQYHWFWFYVPFATLGLLFAALPLITDGLARGFDFKEHRRLVGEWHPKSYPSVDVFLPVCGNRRRRCGIHGSRGRNESLLPGNGHRLCAGRLG